EPWTTAVNNGSTTLYKLFDSVGNQIAEVRCLNGHRQEILNTWDACAGINPEAIPELIEALKIIKNDSGVKANGHNPESDTFTQFWHLADTALAKAKGGES